MVAVACGCNLICNLHANAEPMLDAHIYVRKFLAALEVPKDTDKLLKEVVLPYIDRTIAAAQT